MSKTPLIRFKSETIDGIRYGSFVFSPKWYELYDRLIEAEGRGEAGDMEGVMELVSHIEKDYPDFFHFYTNLGYSELDDNNYGNAEQYFMQSVVICNRVIPKKFKGKLDWLYPDNRPFLRAYFGLGLTLLYCQNWRDAIEVFEKIIEYNPNDNQGVRSALIECYLALGNYKKIVQLCKNYPDDTLVDIIYGKVLAYFRLQQLDNARTALKTARQYSPFTAKELVKKNHSKRYFYDMALIVAGSKEEGYNYWARMGYQWTDPQVIKFIREELSDENA